MLRVLLGDCERIPAKIIATVLFVAGTVKSQETRTFVSSVDEFRALLTARRYSTPTYLDADIWICQIWLARSSFLPELPDGLQVVTNLPETRGQWNNLYASLCLKH